MSNPFGWLTPPGCGANDTGPMGEDDYKCEVCGRTCTQGELDPGADDPVCRECAALREEEGEKVGHTSGPWRIGKTGCVICDTHDDTTFHSPGELASYDGALIAESIKHPANARLIAAAPRMAEYLTKLAKDGDNEAHAILQEATGLRMPTL